jgi:glutamate synthase (NADPH/NADH) large chain
MTQFGDKRLHLLITRHARFTDSRRAAEVLANWRDYLPKFRKVMPVEFSRALAEMAKASLQAAE